LIGATIRPAEAFEWMTAYGHFLEAAQRFYKGMDGLLYGPNPAAIATDAFWTAIAQAAEASPETIREIARMSSADRLATAEGSIRVVGYHRRKRRSDLESINQAETALADLARRFGPLPGTNSGPAAGSGAPATT
jgi:hypothetical protein